MKNLTVSFLLACALVISSEVMFDVGAKAGLRTRPAVATAQQESIDGLLAHTESFTTLLKHALGTHNLDRSWIARVQVEK